MNKRNWTKGTLLALVTTALSACSSDPGSSLDGDSTDPGTGEAEGAWGAIAPIGATQTLGCSAQQLFDVSSLSQNIGWIAVDSGDWAAANTSLQLFSVDQAGNMTRLDSAAQSVLHTANRISTAHQAASQQAAASHVASANMAAGSTTIARNLSTSQIDAVSSRTATSVVDSAARASRVNSAVSDAAATHQAAANAAQVATVDQAAAASANQAAASSAAQSADARQAAAANQSAVQNGNQFASQSFLSPFAVGGGCGIGLCGGWGGGLDGSSFGNVANSVSNLISNSASQSAAQSQDAAAAQQAAASQNAAQRSSAASTNQVATNEAAADSAHQAAANRSAAAQASHLASAQTVTAQDHALTATRDVSRVSQNAFSNANEASRDVISSVIVNDAAASDAVNVLDQANSRIASSASQAIASRTQAFTDLQSLQSKHLVLQLNFNGNTASSNVAVAAGSASQTFATGLFPVMFTPCGL